MTGRRQTQLPADEHRETDQDQRTAAEPFPCARSRTTRFHWPQTCRSIKPARGNNNNNNNNTKDDIYSAVIMTQGYCESSLGSSDELQNSAQAAADSQTKPRDLGCESACRQLSSTTTIAIYYYYYSARKLILTYRPTEGRRLS